MDVRSSNKLERLGTAYGHIVSQQQSYILPRTASCDITQGRRSRPDPGNICAMIVSSISMYSVVLPGIYNSATPSRSAKTPS